MKIVVFNLKGGQGKTFISVNLALTLGYGIITNEPYSRIDKMIEDKKRYLKLDKDQPIPILPEKINVIFDFGGYLDERVIEALKIADKIVIPVVNESKNDVATALSTVNEIRELNQNIVIIANRATEKQYREIEAVFNKAYKKRYPVFRLKESKAIPHIEDEKISIKEMTKQGGLKRYHYKAIDEQFDKIINHITKDKK